MSITIVANIYNNKIYILLSTARAREGKTGSIKDPRKQSFICRNCRISRNEVRERSK